MRQEVRDGGIKNLCILQRERADFCCPSSSRLALGPCIVLELRLRVGAIEVEEVHVVVYLYPIAPLVAAIFPSNPQSCVSKSPIWKVRTQYRGITTNLSRPSARSCPSSFKYQKVPVALFRSPPSRLLRPFTPPRSLWSCGLVLPSSPNSASGISSSLHVVFLLLPPTFLYPRYQDLF